MKKHLLIIIIIIVIVINLIPTPYYLLSPGQAIDLSQNIIVENGEKDAKGRFLLTSTTIVKANLLLYIYSFFDPNIDLKNKSENITEGMDQKEYIDIMERLMQESQMVSKIVALRKAGYYPEISGKGIIVKKILENSPTKNKLIPGDVIVKVNEQPIRTVEEFSKIIQGHTMSQLVKITFLRNNSPYSISIPLIELPTSDYTLERLGIGIYATTKDLQCKFPVKIEIDLDKIKGPSAGLMIALEILNQLTENDLSSGLVITGTGNLSVDGKITEVDGIKQKIISAKKQKADIFLVPKENYQEALKFNQNIKVIPVENFDDAIMKLIKL
ncbi:MAG: PDZ domain-containing protein [Candidatus Atribacteria bacterium]